MTRLAHRFSSTSSLPVAGHLSTLALAGRSALLIAVFSGTGCASHRLSPEEGKTTRPIQAAIVDEETERSASKDFEIPPQSAAQYDFLRGQLALNNDHYDEALKYLERAAKQEPSPAPTLRRSLAQLYIRLGRVDDALTEVDRALKQSPNDVELLQLRGGLLATKHDSKGAIETYRKILTTASPQNAEETYVLISSLQAQDGDIEGAKTTLQELIGKVPESFFGHYYLGRMCEASRQLTDAETHYKRALEVNPQADSVRIDLARVLGGQKRFKEGIDLAKQFVQDNPKNAQARALLAQLYIGSNQVDQAIEEFEQVGALQADPTEARLKIALIKLQRRDLEGAIVDLNLVLAQHPDNNAARYYLASAYAGLKKISEAVGEIKKIGAGQEYFVESRVLGALMLQQEKRGREALDMAQEASSNRPEDVKILTLRATLEHENKNSDAAIATMRRVVELEPNKDKHFFTLGVFLDEAGKKDEANAIMQKAIELEPKNANALNYLGYSLVERGTQLDQAESYIRRAIEVEKDNGYFIDSLGWLYFQQGKYREAAKELERAVKFAPTDSVILEHYARALIKTGNKKLAETIIKRAQQHVAESDDKDVDGRLKQLLSELQG